MDDRASVNGVATRTVKVVHLNASDIGFFLHTIDCVGEQFKSTTSLRVLEFLDRTFLPQFKG